MSGKEGQGVLEIGSTSAGSFKVDANPVATGGTCVLGSSGSGKSYTVGILCEEFCRNNISFVEGFESFLYPTFKVELVMKRRHRQVRLDGRSGKELAL